MAIFKLKTSDPAVYNAYITGQNLLTIDHLIQYENDVTIGAPVLFSFGGDNEPWTNGLYAIAKIHSKPIDLGYETAARGQQYYKLEIEIALRLPRIWEKKDFIRYPESFDSGVAPSTKGERNQALGIIEEKPVARIASICRAILDESPEFEDLLREIFGTAVIDYALQHSMVFVLAQHENRDSVNNNNKEYEQIIYYGVPGCGKSNKIREKLKDVPEKNKVRVVFHPEYTNAEFIGQILPKVNGHVTYEFTPGPFTQIIKRAYLNPNEQFYLVIEEINRGNAAAIFGDTFQLLDRLKAGETDSLGNDPANAAVNTFTEGWSQYFVQNDDVNAYIRKATKLDDGSYQERNDGEPIEEIKIKEIHFNANTAIRLPPNLSILATMNTSDQNVFTLDNAFQRRFDMELVRNEFELATKDVDKSKYGGFKTADIQTQHDAKIADTDVKWGDFWEWINKKIVSTLKGLSSTEDKRLGVWFVSNIDGKIEEKIFAEKVLKYLWDDVFKFKRPQVFASEIDTLENLIAAFGKSRFAVFKEALNSSSSIAESSQNEGAANQ